MFLHLLAVINRINAGIPNHTGFSVHSVISVADLLSRLSGVLHNPVTALADEHPVAAHFSGIADLPGKCGNHALPVVAQFLHRFVKRGVRIGWRKDRTGRVAEFALAEIEQCFQVGTEPRRRSRSPGSRGS